MFRLILLRYSTAPFGHDHIMIMFEIVHCKRQETLITIHLQALRDQRRVVTAYWLNDVLLKKKMQPPWQALHLPLLYSGDSKPCSDQVRILVLLLIVHDYR